MSKLLRNVWHTDIRDGRSHSDLNSRVSLLGQLALEELVQFGIENTVGDELATLGDGSLLSRHDCGVGGESIGIDEALRRRSLLSKSHCVGVGWEAVNFDCQEIFFVWLRVGEVAVMVTWGIESSP